jgi:4-hydroxybenzoate polyprenyltransferase
MGNAHTFSTPSIWRTLGQLFRLPAVFTAMSDIAMGAIVALSLGTSAARLPAFLFLLVASSCIYLAGMVLNDVADAEVDRRERSGRPIPSGRISRKNALTLGCVLLALGLGLSALVQVEGGRSFLTCLVLVLAVVAYDFSPFAWLRLLLMPLCRVLNVLLGLSAAELAGVPWGARFFLAGVVGLYILGVTLFARNEAGHSHRRTLRLALLFMAAAVGIALAAPVVVERSNPAFAFPYLLLALVWLVALPASRALHQPTPDAVQATVRKALQCIILLDAGLACGIAGNVGLLILLLLIPNWYAGRWLSST